ncbi:MAG: hypothetical protein LBJ25_06270 [Candidatus Margulisbacteria bacterium]|jgi:hypothetical protein|nr:hypothetical protein [Candidatus Margulisiibacteriota bacterium]
MSGGNGAGSIKSGNKPERNRMPENKNKAFIKTKIGKVDNWSIAQAKKVGIDIEGYDHEVTSDFYEHIEKHKNVQEENNRGNIAITDEDIRKIPEIIEQVDYGVFGFRRDNEYRIIYAKHFKDGTSLYFEEILSGKKNKTLRGKTLYKRRGRIDKSNILICVAEIKIRKASIRTVEHACQLPPQRAKNYFPEFCNVSLNLHPR